MLNRTLKSTADSSCVRTLVNKWPGQAQSEYLGTEVCRMAKLDLDLIFHQGYG
jgi:hypothetical protein